MPSLLLPGWAATPHPPTTSFRGLSISGNEVHILTGGRRDEEENEINPDGRLKQLRRVGITRFTVVFQVARKDRYPGVGVGKGEYCRDQGIDMVLEDDPFNIDEIKKIALNTQAFLIQ